MASVDIVLYLGLGMRVSHFQHCSECLLLRLLINHICFCTGAWNSSESGNSTVSFNKQIPCVSRPLRLSYNSLRFHSVIY